MIVVDPTPQGIDSGLRNPFRCDICEKSFARVQELRRHHRDKHEPRTLCTYCHSFEWSRRDFFMAHLKKHHPDVDPRAAIEAERTRIRDTVIGRYPPRQGAPSLTLPSGLFLPDPQPNGPFFQDLRTTLPPLTIAFPTSDFDNTIVPRDLIVPEVSNDPSPPGTASRVSNGPSLVPSPHPQVSNDPSPHDPIPQALNDPPPSGPTPQVSNDPPQPDPVPRVPNDPPPSGPAPQVSNDPSHPDPVPQVPNDPQPPGPVSPVVSTPNNIISHHPERFPSYYLGHLLTRTRSVNKKRHGVFTSGSNTLHSTFLSWLRNMDRLSALISQLSELAATAPEEHQSQLFHQVVALRKDFKKQQERYAAFLRLTKEYADRFLSDISDEIQQQSSFLDAMENRLHMAENLRKRVVDLRESYDLGTLKCIKKVRDTVLSQPLPEDVKLFKEMDTLIDEIRQCLREMNIFWDDEVRRVTKAFKDRRVDPEDIERWKEFRESLRQTIEHWETRSADNAVALYPDTRPSVHELGRIASFLSDKAKAVQDTLERVWLSRSAALEYVRPDDRSRILQARVKSSSNRKSCLEFLRESFRYGQRVAMTCNAFVSYSPFLKSRMSQDLVDDAARLGAERIEVSAETAFQMRSVRPVNSIHKKSISLLHKMAHNLDALPTCISTWVTELDAHSTFPALNIKDLLRLSCVWLKNRDAIEQILIAVLPLGEPDAPLPLLETRA